MLNNCFCWEDGMCRSRTAPNILPLLYSLISLGLQNIYKWMFMVNVTSLDAKYFFKLDAEQTFCLYDNVRTAHWRFHYITTSLLWSMSYCGLVSTTNVVYLWSKGGQAIRWEHLFIYLFHFYRRTCKCHPCCRWNLTSPLGRETACWLTGLGPST